MLCVLFQAPIADTVNSVHLDSIHDDQEKFHPLDVFFDDSVRKNVENFSPKTSVSDKEKNEFEGTDSFVDSSVSILERFLGGSLQNASSSTTSAAVSICM